MTTINGLFATTSTSAVGTSTLAGTQQLTNIASTIANTVFDLAAGQPNDYTYSELVASSMSNMNDLDSLITQLGNIQEADIEFLKTLDTATLDGMLKSQQSKRSRCKSKEMTKDNYLSMMTAAIAEMLIRAASGKDKGTSGRAAGDASYTEARLEELALDQEALRKEIRNVQSKKSILKSKAGFTEEDSRWLVLLVAEEQLKGIRVDGGGKVTTKVVNVIDPLRNTLKELLAEVDPEPMKAKDLKALVASIKEYVWSDATEEDATEEETPTEEAEQSNEQSDDSQVTE